MFTEALDSMLKIVSDILKTAVEDKKENSIAKI